MLLDAENGNPMEVEVIFGEVVRMAKVRGVEVPVGARLVGFFSPSKDNGDHIFSGLKHFTRCFS